MTQTLQERLRGACESIRRNSMPLADLIPLMAQAADALDKPPTGLDPEMGFILEAATAGEWAAYDHGCNGMMAALERILDGKDDGAGVANPPWEPLRRRVIELVGQRESLQTLLNIAVSMPGPGDWADARDQWSAQIEAAHPIRTKAYSAYDTALEMVGHRRSKGELVELVCWLLQQRGDVKG